MNLTFFNAMRLKKKWELLQVIPEYHKKDNMEKSREIEQ